MILCLNSVSLFSLVFSILIFSPTTKAQLMSEYTRKTGQLNTLERKVTTTKDEIRDELKGLSVEKDDEKKKQLFESIEEKHTEYLKSVKEYNTVRQELKYKFPKKHDTTTRRYLPLREQTLDEIENEVGIDSVLTRVKQKLDKTYRPFTVEADAELETSKPKKSAKEEKERIRLER